MPAPVELSIYKVIGPAGVTADSFLAQLDAAGGADVTVRINSEGGSIFQGLAIYNRLLNHPGKVRVKIDGFAASMASVIAMASDDVEIASNGFIMIHRPNGGAEGDSDDLQSTANVLKMLEESLVGAYTRKTKMSAERILAMLKAETYLTAEQALAFGFVDRITEPLRMAAAFDTSLLPSVPAHIISLTKLHNMAKQTLDSLTAQLTEITGERDTFKAQLAESATNLLNAEKTCAQHLETITAKDQEIDRLNAQFTELVADAIQARADLTAKVTELDTLTAQLTGTTGKLEAASKNIERLEALCGIKGIDANNAAPNLETNSEDDAALYDRFANAAPDVATAMYSDPELNARIRRESARRHAGR